MKRKNIIISFFVIWILAIVFSYYVLLKPNVVNIAYMSDKKYLPYIMTSMYSLIKNKEKTSHYKIYVLAKDFDEEDVNKLKKLENEDVTITVKDIKEKDLNYTNLGRFKSYKMAMQKIFISSHLEDIDKILYIDGDTLIQKDLTRLYNEDVSSVYLAATKDGLMYQFPYHITEVELEWRGFYFNTGVMLLNLNKIRQDDIVSQAIDYFHSHSEVFGDQDVFNVVVKDKVKSLSYNYNLNSTFFEEKDAEFLSEFYGEKVYNTAKENYDNATILHFAGHKPWTEWYTHTYLKPLWYEYYNELTANYNINF
ncbi:MAG: glycosyltransferase family 8 protein [Alphaproteobacteria bacterium]|nr:glycosyltransferase family 8 protein [Alphaproteobacteria bacterium]